MNKFVPDPLIDATRREYMLEYDALFLKIMASVKGSAEHRRLRKKEVKLHVRTVKFLKEYKTYFLLKKDAFHEFLDYREVAK